jgi:hypothetical protein
MGRQLLPQSAQQLLQQLSIPYLTAAAPPGPPAAAASCSTGTALPQSYAAMGLTGNPFSASSMAGPSTSSNVTAPLPQQLTASSQRAAAPAKHAQSLINPVELH